MLRYAAEAGIATVGKMQMGWIPKYTIRSEYIEVVVDGRMALQSAIENRLLRSRDGERYHIDSLRYYTDALKKTLRENDEEP